MTSDPSRRLALDGRIVAHHAGGMEGGARSEGHRPVRGPALTAVLVVGLLVTSALVPVLRWPVLVALVAALPLARRRGGLGWPVAAGIPVAVNQAWGTVDVPAVAAALADCTNLLSPLALWRAAEAVVVLSVVAVLVRLMGSSAGEPLVPALQNNLLLTVHVAVAIIAYGSFTIAFGAALLYLIQPEGGRWGLPRPETLDEISYRAIVVGFPFLTAVILLGALWAEVAWGSYWSWDPKETASLVTWLIYGSYLHARVVRGWRGQRAAWLLMLGFLATLLTYFGNLFFGGLHSYAGLG